MARAGEVLENPLTGERIAFHRTAGDTNGEALEYEVWARPRGFFVQEHVHPRQEERHEVVDDTIRLRIDIEERVLGPGDSVTVPAGTPHQVVAEGEDLLKLRMQSRPALRSEQLLELFMKLGRDERVARRGRPSLLQLAVVAREFEDEGYPTRPPLAVQRAIFGPLAALGRLRGYRVG